MQLTTHTDYALRLLVYLAVHHGKQPATIQDAASRFGISSNHLAKVAQTLVQHGYIVSHRGRGGGLKLALPVGDIGIGKLVRKTENLQLLPCFSDEIACPIQPACILRNALHKAQAAFLKVLDDYTLADVIFNKDRLQELLEIPESA